LCCCSLPATPLRVTWRWHWWRGPRISISSEEKRTLQRDMIPAALAVVPALAARWLFAESHPTLAAEVDASARLGHVRVIVVANGGATLLHVPLGAPSPIGTA
jgi:hypothetical protein